MRDLAQCRLLPALAVSLLIHFVFLCSPVTPLSLRLNPGRLPMQVVVRSAERTSDSPKADLARPPPRSDLLRSSPRAGGSVPQGKSRRAALPEKSRAIAPPVAPTAAVHGTEAALSPPSDDDGISAQGLRDYRFALATAARRFKRYPAPARESGWEGTAEVAVIFNRWSPGAQVVLVRSSGRDVLDKEALSMLQQAAGATDLPDSLWSKSFRVVLPVVFSLAD
jgi:protein TonB